MNPQVNCRLGYQVFTETESRRYRCQSTLIDMLLMLIVFWPEAKSMVIAFIHNYVSCVINRSRYKPKYMYNVQLDIARNIMRWHCHYKDYVSS